MLICFFLFIFFDNVVSSCSASSCSSCVANGEFGLGGVTVPCRWCPESGLCHAFGSLFNPCSSNEQITEVSKCPAAAQKRTSFSRSRAELLAKLSWAAYEQRYLNAKNLPPGVEVLFKYQKPYRILQELRSFIAVSHSAKRIFVVFRGTPGISVQLLNQVIDTGMEILPPKYKTVEYFKEASETVCSIMRKDLQATIKKYPQYGVSFTGHSLGGALGTVAAMRFSLDKLFLNSDVELYTFGQPRTGDKLFATDLAKRVPKTFRVVNDRDPIPHFPNEVVSSWGPTHFQTEIWYGEENVCGEYRECVGQEDPKCSLRFSVVGKVLNIGDHSMENYLKILRKC